jgi:hypothetical protein
MYFYYYYSVICVDSRLRKNDSSILIIPAILSPQAANVCTQKSPSTSEGARRPCIEGSKIHLPG